MPKTQGCWKSNAGQESSEFKGTVGRQRIPILDVLRAIAALSVCFFHFNHNSYAANAAISGILSYGHLGVTTFFVISGFVMPLALFKSGFRLPDIGVFLTSRVLRLYPSFVVSICFVILIRYVSVFVGSPDAIPEIKISELLANLTLSADFFGIRWFIPIFWTLAIEAQFYVAIALSFPFLVQPSVKSKTILILLWISSPLALGAWPSIFVWTALFAMGILVFLKKYIQMSRLTFWSCFVAAVIVQWSVKGLESAVVGVVTALLILYFPNVRIPGLCLIGTISYSLYLVHLPIGKRIIDLIGRRSEACAYRLVILAFSLMVSLFVAYVVFMWVERPSHHWAKRFKHRK